MTSILQNTIQNLLREAEGLPSLSTAGRAAREKWSDAEARYDVAISSLREIELKNVASHVVRRYLETTGKKPKASPGTDFTAILKAPDVRQMILKACRFELERKARQTSANPALAQDLIDIATSEVENILTRMSDKVRNGTYYDVSKLEARRVAAERALEMAKKNYAYYDPTGIEYEFDPAREEQMALDEPTEVDAVSPAVAHISDLPTGVWIAWPQEVLKIKYGSRQSDEETSGETADIAAVGPGEERLAAVFGGRVQGGSTSYDIVTPGRPPGKWEVKALESQTATIRPGTEGAAAYDTARAHIERVMKQIKEFTSTAHRYDLDVAFKESFNDNERKIDTIVKACKNFIAAHYEMIVSKGEISDRRFLKLQRILDILNKLIKFVQEETGKETTDQLMITVAGKDVVVDKSTYIDILRKLEKMPGGEDLLKSISALEVAVAVLTDSAFDDPTQFYEQWQQLVKASDVFRQVDGVIVVNADRGFCIVPKSNFDTAFQFNKVSQGKPRFIFTGFNTQITNLKSIVSGATPTDYVPKPKKKVSS